MLRCRGLSGHCIIRLAKIKLEKQKKLISNKPSKSDLHQQVFDNFQIPKQGLQVFPIKNQHQKRLAATLHRYIYTKAREAQIVILL